jgi:hypothetical protein
LGARGARRQQLDGSMPVRAHLPPTRRGAGALSARYGVVGRSNLATLSSPPFSVNSKIFGKNEICSDLQKPIFKLVQIRKLFKSKKKTV